MQSAVLNQYKQIGEKTFLWSLFVPDAFIIMGENSDEVCSNVFWRLNRNQYLFGNKSFGPQANEP